MEPTAVAIDTNVLVAANGHATHTEPACALAASRFLRGMRAAERRILLDNAHEILRQYIHTGGAAGRGAGSEFVRWLFRHQYNSRHCERVDSHPIASDPWYEPYPNAAECASFDRDDRKFLSAAVASAGPARVANATDTDWCDVQQAIRDECGIELVSLCPTSAGC